MQWCFCQDCRMRTRRSQCLLVHKLACSREARHCMTWHKLLHHVNGHIARAIRDLVCCTQAVQSLKLIVVGLMFACYVCTVPDCGGSMFGLLPAVQQYKGFLWRRIVYARRKLCIFNLCGCHSVSYVGWSKSICPLSVKISKVTLRFRYLQCFAICVSMFRPLAYVEWLVNSQHTWSDSSSVNLHKKTLVCLLEVLVLLLWERLTG